MQTIINRIKSYQPKTLPETPIASAVLVLGIYDDQENLFLIITKRSDTIAYAGDYCFPGGARDGHEEFIITAQREVSEELGITTDYYQMIGQLDDFEDRYSNRVRPFVALMTKVDFEQQMKISADEIAEVHYFPLDELRRIGTSVALEAVTRRHPSYLYEDHGVRIWGLTANIMVHFGNVIFGLDRPIGRKLK